MTLPVGETYLIKLSVLYFRGKHLHGRYLVMQAELAWESF